MTSYAQAMQRYVDRDILPGVSWALLRGQDLIDQNCVGWADREKRVALRPDHIFRAFSNSKLVTSCAVLLLIEEGKLDLDDAIERTLPQLGNRRVLKPGASRIDDTVPAERPITIRHLLAHTSGLSYGLFDPGTPIHTAYNERKVLNPATPLSDMIEQLAELPLTFQPGTSWEYSVATDVLGRVVEVVSGQSFGDFLQARIFGPLGMTDTGFIVPEAERDRLVGYYIGADLADPMKPGLQRIDGKSPYPGAYVRLWPRQSGGGGLVTTLPDMVALVRALQPGSSRLLQAETLALMGADQLPRDQVIRFATLGPMPGKGFGLAGSVTRAPAPADPPQSAGELQWGGVAGTHWWICPPSSRGGATMAGVLMTQRYMAFWNPFFFEFKRLVYAAHA
jgi:CubicO group peptidase (beta-lactamase class C family)